MTSHLFLLGRASRLDFTDEDDSLEFDNAIEHEANVREGRKLCPCCRPHPASDSIQEGDCTGGGYTSTRIAGLFIVTGGLNGGDI